MRKFFKFFVALLVAFILVNFLYLFLMPGMDWSFRKTKEASRFKDQQFKVLVFGNSTALDGVNTELISSRFGQAYNFSVGGATLETSYTQLKKYLEKNAKPERVLLFLSSTHIKYKSGSEIHPVIDYYYGNAFSIHGLKDIPLFKFRWLFIENFKKLLSSDHRSAKLVQGQLRINRTIKDNSTKKNQDDSCYGNSFYLSPGYEYMWKIIDVCKKAGIEIEVFEMPCWKEFQNNCPNIVISKRIDTANYTVHVYNLNDVTKCDAVLDPKKDWLSKNHLNYDGSIKVTDEIMRLLSTQASLTNAK